MRSSKELILFERTYQWDVRTGQTLQLNESQNLMRLRMKLNPFQQPSEKGERTKEENNNIHEK